MAMMKRVSENDDEEEEEEEEDENEERNAQGDEGKSCRERLQTKIGQNCGRVQT